MKVVLRSAIGVDLIYSFAAFVLHVQDSVAKPQVTIDYVNDPCGNPMTESQLWTRVKGKVSRVIDGRTLIVTLPHKSHPLRVYLVGVGLETKGQGTAQAKELPAQLLRDKIVEIVVNPRWDLAHKRPSEVIAVGQIGNSTAETGDVGLFLLSKGLLKFQEPAPYSMSRHTECQYKHAEAEAQAKKLGMWANNS